MSFKFLPKLNPIYFQLENFRAQHWNRKRKLKMGNRQDEEEDEEASTGFASLILLTAFLLYVAFGALLLPLLNGEVPGIFVQIRVFSS